MSRTVPPGATVTAPDDGTVLVHSGAVYRHRYRFKADKSIHEATEEEPDYPWPDISSRAKWSVSSYKFGFGAECLRDADPETFWQ